MKFKTQFNYIAKKYVSVNGTHTVDINEVKKTGEKKLEIGYEYNYSKHYDRDGRRELIISGRTNVYDKIQSFKDDVDIYKILKKYNNDLSVFDKNKGMYIDTTQIPKNFSDYHNKVVEIQRVYDSLPTDFKQEFGNNINTFANSIFNKDFEGRYSDYVFRKNVSNRVNVNNNINNAQSNVNNNGGDDNVK